MKELIRKILKESVMDNLLDSVFPELSNLKTKSNYSAKLYGDNTIYYNKDDKNYYFRVSEPRKTYVWGLNDTVETKYSDKTLFIDGKTYDEILNYFPDKDMIIHMILKWFNEKYKQDAKTLIRKSPLKRE
jgi:hypothetical protein